MCLHSTSAWPLSAKIVLSIHGYLYLLVSLDKGALIYVSEMNGKYGNWPPQTVHRLLLKA